MGRLVYSDSEFILKLWLFLDIWQGSFEARLPRRKVHTYTGQRNTETCVRTSMPRAEPVVVTKFRQWTLTSGAISAELASPQAIFLTLILLCPSISAVFNFSYFI
jgi:hypothetical protein